jgi:ADP-ribose pyrophosphatase YjhB (NUDIX family)/predicted TPR repeat methyltransferase
MDDLTTATYDRVAGRFAERHFDLGQEFAPRLAFAQAVAGPAPPERFRILDAGCGPGRDSKWFHGRGFHVIGVDRSAGMLAEARRRAPGVEFRQGDLRALDFPDGSFDGIWCCASLLHLARADVPPVLASFNRLLGHGYLWLSVKQGLSEEVEERAYGAGNPRRFTYFQRPELELLVERAGFDVHEVSDGEISKRNPHPWLSILAQTKLRLPLLGATAVIFDEQGRVLLSERADGRGWNLPCGFSDADESPDETAIRETREETGLAVEIERLLGIYSWPRTHRENRSRIVTHAYLCRVVGGDLVLTNEALAHGWFAPDGLPEPLSSRRHAQIVQDALEMRAGRVAEPFRRSYP